MEKAGGRTCDGGSPKEEETGLDVVLRDAGDESGEFESGVGT